MVGKRGCGKKMNALIRPPLSQSCQTLLEEDSEEMCRGLCRSSLKFLCRDALGYKDWDTCHDDLERFLEQSKKRFKLILMPRGHLKSSVVTIGKAIQHVLNEPDSTILLVNAVWDNARSFLAEAKEYLTRKSFLPSIFGTFESGLWNQDEVVVVQRNRPSKTPTFSTAGQDKALASQHYKYIFADDLVNRQTISTREQRDKGWKFYSDLLDLLEPDGTLYMVGTRWHDGDIYGRIIREQADKFDIHIRRAREEGRVIFPRKFSDKILDDLKSQKGTYEYSAQYENEPSPEGSRIFRPPSQESKARYWTDLGAGAVHTVTVDLAISEKAQADYTVVMDCAMTRSGQMYVVEYARGRFDPLQTVEKIFEYAQKFKPKKVGIESVGYQKALVNVVQAEQKRRNMFFPVEPIISTRDKFSRILMLQPSWESGNLLLKQGMVELEDELERFPASEHDDLLDALAYQLFVAEQTGYHRPKVWIPQQYRREIPVG